MVAGLSSAKGHFTDFPGFQNPFRMPLAWLETGASKWKENNFLSNFHIWHSDLEDSGARARDVNRRLPSPIGKIERHLPRSRALLRVNYQQN
jgi:hypothetical protein